MATRHLCRILVLQSLYEWSFWGYPEGKEDEILDRNLEEFGNDIDEPEFARKILKGVAKNLEFIDGKIGSNTRSIQFEQISLLEKNILRLAVYELCFQKHEEVPQKVAINEAVELAKNFASDGAAKFINAVLGSIYDETMANAE
ncbi:MAG: transcription antitermination factor NusB [Patescibacteria group bacterium]